MKINMLLLLGIFMTSQGKSQSLKLFDTAVNTHRVALCDLVQCYIDTSGIGGVTEFTHYVYDWQKSFYVINFKGSLGELRGLWYFVMRRDTLNQYGFGAEETKPTPYNYTQYYKAADSVISYFTVKYGTPIRDTALYNLKNIRPGWYEIRKAMWVINGQKLVVEFKYDHKDKKYMFDISRFKDYHGNFELPPWWDGY